MNPSLAKRRSPVSSYTLKLIAVVSMLIDHTAQAIRSLAEAVRTASPAELPDLADRLASAAATL